MHSCALIECERQTQRLYWLVTFIALGWLCFLSLAPWLMTTGRVLPALILYRVFALVCHQMPERSFSGFGFALPVCMRCTGVYVGFALGWLLSVRLPAMRRNWFIAALAPLAFDWALGVTGLWANTPVSRTFTGVLAGSALAWWLYSHRHSLIAEIHSGETFLHG
jgi:uncharacterized membrane protein